MKGNKVVSAERDAIQPEYEIALAHFAKALKRRQEQLPLWIGEALQAYGVACCKRGMKLAHDVPTLKASPWDNEPTPIEIRWDDDGS